MICLAPLRCRFQRRGQGVGCHVAGSMAV